jgi:hypothetical protein
MSRLLCPATLIMLVLAVGSVDAADKAAVKCSTGKQKAAVKKIGSKLKCQQKANAADLPVDQACLAKAETKFSESIGKIEAKGGCIVTGDEALIEDACDDCVDRINELTPAAPPTCGQTAYPQCGGTCPPGLACQAFLRRTTASGGGGGTGGTQSCDTSGECVDPTMACDGAACGRICDHSENDNNGNVTINERCCGGFGNRCDATTGNPGCCCTGACFDPPFGSSGGTCLTTPACSGTVQVCQ